MPNSVFFGSPQQIRRVLLDRVGQHAELKLAVAFVTAEWMRVQADFEGTGAAWCVAYPRRDRS